MRSAVESRAPQTQHARRPSGKGADAAACCSAKIHHSISSSSGAAAVAPVPDLLLDFRTARCCGAPPPAKPPSGATAAFGAAATAAGAAAAAVNCCSRITPSTRGCRASNESRQAERRTPQTPRRDASSSSKAHASKVLIRSLPAPALSALMSGDSCRRTAASSSCKQRKGFEANAEMAFSIVSACFQEPSTTSNVTSASASATPTPAGVEEMPTEGATSGPANAIEAAASATTSASSVGKRTRVLGSSSKFTSLR
mmetsp:Transcript_57191/g.185221  ORF Transcript_57191/g.185221 Transcript_57191/m.185221 type:complete len:256 (-) Transcript_57191:933-1700(-)